MYFLLLNFHLVSIVAQELLQQWMADKLTFDNNFDDEDDEFETPRKTQSEIKVEPIFTINLNCLVCYFCCNAEMKVSGKLGIRSPRTSDNNDKTDDNSVHHLYVL